MKRTHRYILSILSGLLLCLPWFGLPGWLAMVGFIPLLILDDYFVLHKESFPEVSFWGHAFLAVLIWNVGASWWMAKVSITGVALAMLLNAFLMSLVLWLIHVARRRYPRYLGYLALIVFWTSYEYFQFKWDLEWPCLQLGSVLADQVKFIQWYEYTGTFGGTIWILLVNVLLYNLIRKLQQKVPLRNNFTLWFSSTLSIVMPLLLSLSIYLAYGEKDEPIHIAIIQPNVDPYTEIFDMKSENTKMDNFLQLSTEVATDQTDLILGPETVFENPWYWNEDSYDTNEFLHRLKAYIHGYKNAELLLGVSTYKVYSRPEEVTASARKKDGMIYDRFNTALFMNRRGEIQSYHKSKLVPGVEKTPFLGYLPFLKDISIDLGGASGTLGRQAEPSNFITKDGTRIGSVICFESVFGAYVTDFVKKGANIIVVMTNDGWWKNTRGYKQHLLFSRLRAIETRRSIARAANTGVSCFIDQRGEILKSTEWWQEAALDGSINANDEISFYVEHGDYLARMCAFLSVLLLLHMYIRRHRDVI